MISLRTNSDNLRRSSEYLRRYSPAFCLIIFGAVIIFGGLLSPVAARGGWMLATGCT